MHTVVEYDNYPTRVQRKSVLQLAIQANYSKHKLAQNSIQLAPKLFDEQD